MTVLDTDSGTCFHQGGGDTEWVNRDNNNKISRITIITICWHQIVNLIKHYIVVSELSKVSMFISDNF